MNNKSLQITLGAVITITIAVILLGAVLSPVIQDTKEITIQYDDYVAVPSGSTVNGNAEIIILEDVTYLHATGIGDATLHSGNKSVSVTIVKAELDVYMAAGQSNSGNYAYNNNEVKKPAYGSAYYYGETDKGLCTPGFSYHANLCDMYPVLNATSNEVIVADKCANFVTSYYEKTGHKVYWINSGIGGVDISLFDPDGSNPVMYNYTHTVLSDAISKVDTSKYNINVCDYIWIQGESDASTSITTYKESFMKYHEALTSSGFFSDMSEWPVGESFNRCIISLMPPDFINSRAAQIQLASEEEDVIIGSDAAKKFTVANGGMDADGLHYAQTGDNIIAEQIVKLCYQNVDTPISPAHVVIHDTPGWNILYTVPVVIIAALILATVKILILKKD